MQSREAKARARCPRRHLITLTTLAVAVAIPVLPAGANPSDPPSVASKQAEAARVLAQVDQLDAELGHAAEAYNAANLHLQATTNALAQNTRLLRFARSNLKKARVSVAARVVQLYTAEESPTVVEVVLGAHSLDDVVSGLDAQDRIVSQDAQIAREVAQFGESVRARQELLATQKQRAERLAADEAATRQRVEGKLHERERLLTSIRDEVARLREVERIQQAELARQVRARLAAQQAAAQAQGNPATGTVQEAQPTPTATPDPAAPAPDPQPSVPQSRYGGVVGIAMRYLGVPYKWGGASPSTGFDCSGFTLYVYAQIGVSLPHYTGSQWQMGTEVSRDQLQPGDLVFFNGLGHEGLYIGNNQMIHSPRTGDVVKISSLTGWYNDTYMGARRL